MYFHSKHEHCLKFILCKKQFYGTIKSVNTWLLRNTVKDKEWPFLIIYLPPMVSFDGAPAYQHHCPELDKGLLETLVILPVSDRGRKYTEGSIFHSESALDHKYQH